MDENEIYNYIISREPISKYFLGVFARDEIPRLINKLPACFIMNTKSRNNAGEHWLAIFINKYSKCYFSIHMVSHQAFITSALQSISNSFNWNMQRIQGDSSYFGFYSIAFLHSICRNELVIFYKNFTTNFSKNDEYIRYLFNKN